MTDLERRALLGDRQAKEECTLHGVVLACPKCFKPVTVRGPEDWQPTFHDPDSGGDPYSFECKCGLAFSTYKYDFKEALSDWNTRPGQPIGRCEECAADPGIDDAPTIDPEELPIVRQLRTELAAARTAAFNLITAVEKLKTPRGKWVPFKSTHAGDIQYCSICGIGFAARTDFCPHCGADMRYYEDQDEEDEGDLNDRVNELGQSFLDGVQQALEWAKAKEGDPDESAQKASGERLP